MTTLRALLLVPFILLAACGGGGDGGGGGGSPPPSAGVNAPSSLSYPSPPVLAVSQAMTPLTPTVTGSVSSYSVSPSLPAGLSINQASGAISGTPTAGAAVATYTVTASNAGGSTAANVSLMVLDAAPDIAYSQSEYKFVKGIAVTPPAPANNGGVAASWSIDHPLPAGLAFNTADGSITGTPTAITPSATYVISASNVVGTDSIALTITVMSGVLIDLGHVEGVTGLDYQGNRVLSHDWIGHWVLWNAQTGKSLAQGETGCDHNQPGDCRAGADIAGPTMVLNTRTGLQVRASSDGSELAAITTAYNWWQLAPDGSYVAAGNSAGLTVWAPTGAILFSKSGNYSAAKAFAATSELRLVGGAQGANVLERLAVPSGASTTSGPLQGQIHSWFLDGDRFITNVGNTIWVYSAAGVQQDLKAMTHIGQLTGQGNWFWTFTNDAARGLDIYEVGASTTPAVNYPLPGPSNVGTASGSGESIFLSYNDDEQSVIDLSGSAPTKTVYPEVPRGTFAAISSTDWVNAASQGIVTRYDNGSRTYFSEGAMRGLAVSATRIAVSTTANRIHLFDAQTFQEEATIAAEAGELDISASGTVLLAKPVGPAATVKIFDLPSGTEIASYTPPSGTYSSVSLLPSGQQWFSAYASGNADGLPTYTREVRSIASGSLAWSDTGTKSNTVRFSSSGASIAAPDWLEPRFSKGTNLFTNGTLVGATLGFPLAWVEENRLLVIRYTSGLFGPKYLGSFLVDGTGLDVSSPALPELSHAVAVSPTSIYAPLNNIIYSLTTGQPIWTSPNPPQRNPVSGGVTGTHVVFYSGTTVRAEPY